MYGSAEPEKFWVLLDIHSAVFGLDKNGNAADGEAQCRGILNKIIYEDDQIYIIDWPMRSVLSCSCQPRTNEEIFEKQKIHTCCKNQRADYFGLRTRR